MDIIFNVKLIQKASPLISVIIPSYNRLEYFKIALNSARNQIYQNIEIIVTDDSTTDQIEIYLKSVNDTRIKYYRNLKNLGIALNVKSGIEKSQGQYFAFLNDDDCWSIDFLENLVSSIVNTSKMACVFADHWLINAEGEILVAASEKNTINYKRNLLNTGIIPQEMRLELFTNFSVPVAMSCLINREAVNLDDYPPEIGGAYDRWILFQCIKKETYHFFYFNERLTQYRVHNQSVTATQKSTLAESVIFILEKSRHHSLFNRLQKISLNQSIRVYIRSMIKQLSPHSLKYLLLYIDTYLQPYK